jgi:hypothetical protein
VHPHRTLTVSRGRQGDQAADHHDRHRRDQDELPDRGKDLRRCDELSGRRNARRQVDQETGRQRAAERDRRDVVQGFGAQAQPGPVVHGARLRAVMLTSLRFRDRP